MPTALGAKIGCHEKQVVSIAGDGGFQFTMEELGAAAHHQIPVQIVNPFQRVMVNPRRFQMDYILMQGHLYGVAVGLGMRAVADRE